MATRRGVIQAGLALAAASGLSPSPPLAQGRPRLSVLVDVRLAESRAFGDEAQAQGAQRLDFSGDITRLWLDVLLPQWRSGPAPMVGLTRPETLMILEQFGRDHDMRVVLRGDHREAEPGLLHRLSAPAEIAQAAAGGRDWARRMARLAMAAPREAGAPRVERAFTDSEGRSFDADRLMSWLIAPVVRA